MIELPLTKTSYVKLRERIGLDPYELAATIGMSDRQTRRWEAGHAEVPECVVKLLIMFARHGIPPDFRGKEPNVGYHP